MNRKKRSKWLPLVMLVLIFSMQDALADSENMNTEYTGFFIPAVYPIENAWNKQDHDFTAKRETTTPAEVRLNSAVGDDMLLPQNNEKLGYESQNKPEEKEWVDNLLEQLPYKNTIKYTWDVMDGDVDLIGVQNLRADIGNRGVEYKTNYIPFAGDVEGTQIKAEMGKDTELKFESDYVPMMGRMEGMKFKAAVGDGASVSLRYKTEVNWQ